MEEDRLFLSGELLSPSENFKEAFDSVGLYWWLWEDENQIIRMSEGLYRILGLAASQEGYTLDIVNQNVHPDDVERNKVLLHQLYSGEDDLYEIEYRIKDSRGRWHWYYNRGSVIRKDETGKPLVIGGITMDISSQFKRLLSMVEEKDKFEFIVRNTNEAVIIIELLEGKAGVVLDANKAAFDLFEKGPDSFGKPLPDFILQDEVIGRGGVLMQEVFEKGSGSVEHKIKLENGKELWLEFNLHAFTLTGENLMIALVKDKTSGKKTEAALRETERLYRTVVESANDRIGLYTAKGEMLLINTAFYETLGYTREEFITLQQYDLTHPDDYWRLEEEGKAVFEKGFSSHEYRVRHKDGHYLDMSSKLVLIRSEDNEPDLILFIMRDITERKRTIKELEEARDRAEESDQLKSAFLANMSHEIRTPMNSIIGFSNLLDQSNLDEELRELYVHRIISNSELLLTLISDIIDLAKIESGQLPIIYGRIMVSDLLKEMEQYARDETLRLQKEKIKIKLSLETLECEIETDVLRITQILKNLINNAVKFTNEGQVEIGCDLCESGHLVRFYVRDTGIGIAEEYFEVIFDQFRQLDGSNTRKFSGTGLGLAICKNLIQMLGGRIWVESSPGRGSCFYVEHPVKLTEKETRVKKGLRNDQKNIPSEGPVAILAVDDEPDTLVLYQAFLTQLGHRVSTADSGYEALRILEQYPIPDLVLMDIEMPVMSGTETLKIIKERYPDLKVVAQSAHALSGDRARFLGEGYDAYLPKPFSAEQLEELISGFSV